MDFALMNWTAVIAGTIAAFIAGFLIYAPFGFGKGWAEGSHLAGRAPDKMPMFALVAQVAGLFLMALTIGLTETAQALDAAILVILTLATMTAALSGFGLKSGYAIAVDTGAVVTFGVLMIAAQAVL